MLSQALPLQESIMNAELLHIVRLFRFIVLKKTPTFVGAQVLISVLQSFSD